MQKIYDIINNLFQEISTSDKISKKSLHSQLNILDQLIVEEIGDITIDNSRFLDILVKNPESRLEELEQKISNISNNVAILPETVALGEDKMRLFLKKYNIGFLSEIYLDQYGRFFVKIPCMISSHTSFHDRDYSKRIEYDMQMKILQELGLDLEPCKVANNKSPAILATQNSIEILTKLIEEKLGGNGLHFQANVFKGQTTIREMTFKVSPDKLYAFNESIAEISCDVSDILNPDEILSLKHELKELSSTLASYNDPYLLRAKESCRSIILHVFSEICKTVGLETKISNEVNLAYVESKRVGEEIKKKEEEIKSIIDPSTIKSNINKILKSIEKFGIEKIGFSFSDIKISRYATVANFSFNTTGNSLEIYCENTKEISEEKLKDIFKTTGGTFDDETLQLTNTQENINKINKLLADEFASAYVSNIDVEYRPTLGYFIKKISINFPKLDVFD